MNSRNGKLLCSIREMIIVEKRIIEFITRNVELACSTYWKLMYI